jgi:hypothetical protein
MRGRLLNANDLRKVVSIRRKVVIRLLSSFPVLLACLTVHVRTTADIARLQNQRVTISGISPRDALQRVGKHLLVFRIDV